MRRGTKVGQAYVALTVDGDNIGSQIADEIEDVDYNQIGRDSKGRLLKGFNSQKAKGFGEELEGEVETASEQMKRAVQNIEEALRNDEVISTGVRRQLQAALKDGSLDATARAVGRRVGTNMGDGFDDQIFGAIVNNLRDAMEDMIRRGDKNFDLTATLNDGDILLPTGMFQKMSDDARRAIQEIEDEQAEQIRQYNKDWDAAIRENLNRQEAAERAIWKVRETSAKAYERYLADREKMYAKLFDEAEKREASRIANYNKDWDDAIREKARREEKAESALWKMRNASAKAHALYLAALERGSIDERGVSTRGVSGNNDGRSMASMVSRLFGGGSRNNFLNLFGRTMGNVVGLVEKGAKFAQGFSQAFSSASEGASLMQKVLAGFKGGSAMSGLSSALAGVTASAPVAAVAVVALIAVLSVLASVVSALIALLTAFVATITSGIAAAAVVGVASLGALAVAGTLVAAAFTSMTAAQKEFLSQSFAPVVDAWRGLGQLVFREFEKPFENSGMSAIEVWAANIRKALEQLAPLASIVGQAIAKAGAVITAAFSGDGVQMFLTALQSSFAGITGKMSAMEFIIVRLSQALGGFINGLAKVFAAAVPYIAEFADYLARLGQNFANADQNGIEDWVGRAVASLKSLWSFITTFVGWVGDVLFSPEAQSVGNTMFDGLTEAFQGFRNAIADGSLEKWFADAIEFGRSLGKVLKSVGNFLAEFYNSGVLTAVGQAFSFLGEVIDALTIILGPFIDIIGYTLPLAIATAVTPLMATAAALRTVGEAVEWLGGLVSIGDGAEWNDAGAQWQKVIDQWEKGFTRPESVATTSWDQALNQSASNMTSSSFGLGDLGASVSGERDWENPYVKWANSLIKQMPGIDAQIRTLLAKNNTTIMKTLRTSNKDFAKSIREAAKADSGESVASAFQNLMESQLATVQNTADTIRTNAGNIVASAQDALSSAAQSLANATTEEAAEKALQAVRKAQRDLAAAKKAQTRANADAKGMENAVAAANAIMAAQTKTNQKNIRALVQGMKVEGATLADYAEARARVAIRLDKANQRLSEALSLRNDYRKSVSDSIKSFGSLLSAQAQVIDGVEQALTANDIVGNLRDRLEQIRSFQGNLRTLLAMGLSNDAYKQLVDAGVEEGSAYAQALVDGGSGAVGQVNDLTNKINNAATALGNQSSNRLYQAGVDAARGLVEGLESLSAQIDSAAFKLGNSIVKAVKRALRSASPSKEMIDEMDNVGSGIDIGLSNQSVKVTNAAARLGEKISVSPEVAAWEAQQSARVSGNGGGDESGAKFRDLIVNTPTDDPEAVAMEVLNEVTGRL